MPLALLPGALAANGINTLSDWAVTLVLAAALAAQCYLFSRLYRSDPGWVKVGTLPEGPAGQRCEYCGCKPPQRSRHDFHTGRCHAAQVDFNLAEICHTSLHPVGWGLLIPDSSMDENIDWMLLGAGQCVAKFDHFCPILATSVGDCNHLMFWCAPLALFHTVETYLSTLDIAVAMSQSALPILPPHILRNS